MKTITELINDNMLPPIIRLLKRFAYWDKLEDSMLMMFVYFLTATFLTIYTTLYFISGTDPMKTTAYIIIIFFIYAFLFPFILFGVQRLLRYYFDKQQEKVS